MKIIRTVSVTNDNITNGDPLSPTTCPIALAFIDAGITSPSVGVDSGGGSVKGDGFFGRFLPRKRVRGVFPKVVSQFIRDFDAGRIVKPITFPFEGSN